MFKYQAYVKEFLDYCRYYKKLSEKTASAYKIDLMQYCCFSDIISKETLWDYIEFLNNKYKPKTVKRKLATLKAFIHYLLIKDVIEFNPFDKIEITVREPLMLPKTIPLGLISQIISYSYSRIIDAHTAYQRKIAVRNAAVLELLFATGARVAEICSLTPERVDLVGRTVKFFGKGSKERIIPLENRSVLTVLLKYQLLFEKEIKKSDFFFLNKLNRRLTEQSVRNMINKYSKSCGIQMHITPHMFRHSFATLLLEEDVDIRYIQKMLGHSSITTTQIYTYVTSNKQKEILKTKHPRNKLKV